MRASSKDNTTLPLQGSLVFRWRIWGSQDGAADHGSWDLISERRTTTTTLDFVFAAAGQRYRVEAARLQMPDGAVLRRGSMEPVCKYVRREIHTLTDRDRALFLDALRVVHTTPGDEGRLLYGPRFTSFEEVTVQHLSNWHVLGCSPYHNGDVFFPSHDAFSSVIEAALQAVHPSTALPYWDTTYEEDLEDWHTSELFTDKWFGPYSDEPDGQGEEYVIRSGPLAYLPIVEAAWGSTWQLTPEAASGGSVGAGGAADLPALSAAEATAAAAATARRAAVPTVVKRAAVSATAHVVAGGRGERNSYGRITDWQNNSPLRYVARSRFVCGVETVAPLPNCGVFGHVLSADSLYNLDSDVSTYFHSFIHPQLGGFWECPVSPKGLLDKYPDAKTRRAMREILLTADQIWAMMTAAGKLSCPAHCSDDTPFKDCTCHCPNFPMDRSNLTLVDAWGVLDGTGVPSFITRIEGLADFITVDETTGQWHFGSGDAEYDTDFGVWLAEFVCAPGAAGPLTSPFASPNDPLFCVSHATFGYFWHFKRLLRANGFFYDDRWSNDNGCSWGHHWDSELPFPHVAGVDAPGGNFTNGELVAVLRPDRLGLPYVYDDFDFQRCRPSWDDAGITDSVFGRARRDGKPEE
ncbi:unnamed protein product [Phaeothamnion confervicola]